MALGTALFICFHILPISFFYVPTVFVTGVFDGATAVRVFVVSSALVVAAAAASLAAASEGEGDRNLAGGGTNVLDVLSAVRASRQSVLKGKRLLDLAVSSWYFALLSIGAFIGKLSYSINSFIPELYQISDT